MRSVFILPLVGLILLLCSCNKPDPKPELKDPIYLDMQTELGIAEKALAEAQKSLEEHKINLEKVVPQTGQIKYGQKRVWDANRTVDLIDQQRKYWVLRMDSRRDYVRRHSLEAFNEGKPWEHEKELAEYEAEKKLRRAKLKWDAKERRETFLKENPMPGPGAKSAGAAGAEGGTPAPSGGGH